MFYYSPLNQTSLLRRILPASNSRLIFHNHLLHRRSLYSVLSSVEIHSPSLNSHPDPDQSHLNDAMPTSTNPVSLSGTQAVFIASIVVIFAYFSIPPTSLTRELEYWAPNWLEILRAVEIDRRFEALRNYYRIADIQLHRTEGGYTASISGRAAYRIHRFAWALVLGMANEQPDNVAVIARLPQDMNRVRQDVVAQIQAADGVAVETHFWNARSRYWMGVVLSVANPGMGEVVVERAIAQE